MTTEPPGDDPKRGQPETKPKQGLAFPAISPVLCFANHFQSAPGQSFGPRYIPHFQILLCLDGQGEAMVGKEIFAVAPNDLVYYGPNILHKVSSSKESPLHLIGLHFLYHTTDLGLTPPGPEFEREDPWPFPGGMPICPLPALPQPFHRFPAGEFALIVQAAQMLVEVFRRENQVDHWEAQGWLLILLARWLEKSSASHPRLASHLRSSHEEKLLRLCREINVHPERAPSAAGAARKAGLAPAYFSRLFRSVAGISYQEAVQEAKLEKARYLLRQTPHRISEIAESAGYSDPLHFSKVFSRRHGMSPSLYRKLHGGI